MAITQRRRSGAVEAEILKDLISCFKIIEKNNKIVTMPDLIDNCQNISVLKLIKLNKFLKNNESELNKYNISDDIKDLQNEIDKYIRVISKVKIGGGPSLKAIALGTLVFLLSFAQGESSVNNRVALRRNFLPNQNPLPKFNLPPSTLNVQTYQPEISQPSLSYSPGAVIPYNSNILPNKQVNTKGRSNKKTQKLRGVEGKPEKIITFGQQADIYLYKTTVVKQFKGQNANLNYVAELKNMQKIQSVKALDSIPIIKMLGHDDATQTIKYARYEKDATSLTSDTLNSNVHANGELNVEAGFSPKAVSNKQVSDFKIVVNLLHDSGIAHGDIHAGNIFLKDGKLGLADMAETKFDPRIFGDYDLSKIDNTLGEQIKKINSKESWEDLLNNRKLSVQLKKAIRVNPQIQDFVTELETYLEAESFDNIKTETLSRFFKN